MASLRKAIDAMCKGCIYDSKDTGGWRYQVANCKVTACPLYEVRPKQAVLSKNSKK
jgi:hypothetical protein